MQGPMKSLSLTTQPPFVLEHLTQLVGASWEAPTELKVQIYIYFVKDSSGMEGVAAN